VTERKPPGLSFETWIDRQIATAESRGAFADLPGTGRPLPGRDRPESSYEWALRWAARENGGLAGMLPPGLALRKEREELPARAASAPSEAAVRALVEDYNARVEQFWRRPQEGPAVPVGLADVDALVERWHASRPPAAEPQLPSAPARRRRWRWPLRRRGQDRSSRSSA
jgi:hypothetical protein